MKEKVICDQCHTKLEVICTICYDTGKKWFWDHYNFCDACDMGDDEREKEMQESIKRSKIYAEKEKQRKLQEAIDFIVKNSN